jgi:formate/nitrite transporter FocA (FNT family)
MPEEQQGNALDLTEKELEEAEHRSAVRAHVIHEAVRKEGEEELKRPTAALAWSGLAAGLSMGFSLVTEGLLRSRLPELPWRPLVSKFGYTIGFLMVILGRQQLFTENTLTAVLPVLHNRNRASLLNMLRLWTVVLFSNLAGALIFAWAAANTAAFQPQVRHAFLQIGQEDLAISFGNALLRGVFAGWLIAMVVWLLPFAETGRVAVIIILTWLVGLAGFTHIIAGSVEVLFVAASGAVSWQTCVAGYMLPTLIGNILGGVSLVAALNHAQVVAGKSA